jgi:acylglycerol lipase
MVKAGIAFVGIDYEGHGQSDGIHGLIPSWDELVGDAFSYFTEVLEKQFPGKPAFLCGEVRRSACLNTVN